MNYSYKIINADRILRPVTVDDAEFIVKLRNQGHAKGTINDTSLDVEKQRQWIRDYLKRENEYYWIIETLDHKPYGTNSLYNYNPELGQMESGRWVKLADAPVANTFAGRVQMYDFAFEVLKLQRLVFDVVSTNKPVLRYHRHCGAVETRVEPAKFIIQGKPVDMIWFEETPESWKTNREKVARLSGWDEEMLRGKIVKVAI